MSGSEDISDRSQMQRAKPGRKEGRKGEMRSFYLPPDLLDRARNAVAFLRVVPGEVRSLSKFVERALWGAVHSAEETYNSGEPFPDVDRLPPGAAKAEIASEHIERARQMMEKPSKDQKASKAKRVKDDASD